MVTQVKTVTPGLEINQKRALPPEGVEAIPAVQKAKKVFEKLKENDSKDLGKHERNYTQHIGPRSGGPGVYYSLTTNLLRQTGIYDMSRSFAGATFGAAAVVGSAISLPEKIKKAKTAFAQEDFSRKVNEGSNLGRTVVGGTFATARITKMGLDLSKSERVSKVAKSVASSFAIVSAVTSGTLFLLMMIPRINAIREIHKARKGFNSIMNNKSLNEPKKRQEVIRFLRNQLRLSYDEKKQIISNVRNELTMACLKENKEASEEEIKAYVKAKLSAVVKERLEAKRSAKRETFRRTFGQVTMDQLHELGKVKKKEERKWRAEEIIHSAKKGLKRQILINALAITGAALGFVGTLLANNFSAGGVALAGMICTLVATAIWIGFDAYNLLTEIIAHDLKAGEIFFKVMNLVFFGVGLAVSQIFQTGYVSHILFGVVSLLWLGSVLFSSYQEKKRKEKIMNKLDS